MTRESVRPPRFFVETWGCQMNEHDSRRMAGQLVAQGMVPSDAPESADLILLNSCSIREKADQKVYSQIGRYRRLKASNPGLKIALCGCVAQREGEAALARVADLDLVLGPGRVGELGRLLPGLRAGERIVAIGFPEEREYDIDAVARDASAKGMVTIIEGCDKRCTFCVVPSTRGPERCRPLAEIVAEVDHLLALGFGEIELLGQTVNHWREPQRPDSPTPQLDFADLLDAVAPRRGLRRLRFVTSYPRDFTPRMVDAFARHPNIADFLHLPVQSGSDRILRRMGRGYEIASYLELVESVRRARPTVALSTDFIVGFPGETDEDFERTLELVERVRFSALYAFRYSPRPGTAAPRLPDPEVPREVAEERLARLLDLQDRVQEELNGQLVGSTQEVVVTGYGKRGDRIQARTSCHRIVHFDWPRGGTAAVAANRQAHAHTAAMRPPAIGDFLAVRIQHALLHSLIGVPVDQDGFVAAPAPGLSSVDLPPTPAPAPVRRPLLPVVG